MQRRLCKRDEEQLMFEHVALLAAAGDEDGAHQVAREFHAERHRRRAATAAASHEDLAEPSEDKSARRVVKRSSDWQTRMYPSA